MPSIVLESVDKLYRQEGFFFSRRKQCETYALNRLSLTVVNGEVLSLLGPNGSGKSTTLKLIATVLMPDRGRVLVNGSDTQKQEQTVRRQVDSLWPPSDRSSRDSPPARICRFSRLSKGLRGRRVELGSTPSSSRSDWPRPPINRL